MGTYPKDVVMTLSVREIAEMYVSSDVTEQAVNFCSAGLLDQKNPPWMQKAVFNEPMPAADAHELVKRVWIKKFRLAETLAKSRTTDGLHQAVIVTVPKGNNELEVLLTAPFLTEDNKYVPFVWHGIFLTPHVEYAGDSDFLLLDPVLAPGKELAMCAVPVVLYVDPTQYQVCASLDPECVRAVELLQAEIGRSTCESLPMFGHIAPRCIGETDFEVVTGTPLGDESDLRHALRTLYKLFSDELWLIAKSKL